MPFIVIGAAAVYIIYYYIVGGTRAKGTDHRKDVGGGGWRAATLVKNTSSTSKTRPKRIPVAYYIVCLGNWHKDTREMILLLLSPFLFIVARGGGVVSIKINDRESWGVSHKKICTYSICCMDVSLYWYPWQGNKPTKIV